MLYNRDRYLLRPFRLHSLLLVRIAFALGHVGLWGKRKSNSYPYFLRCALLTEHEKCRVAQCVSSSHCDGHGCSASEPTIFCKGGHDSDAVSRQTSPDHSLASLGRQDFLCAASLAGCINSWPALGRTFSSISLTTSSPQYVQPELQCLSSSFTFHLNEIVLETRGSERAATRQLPTTRSSKTWQY